MKQLTCEMCGSHDLIKVDGVFECQFCKAKYTVEEAKKMMVEGTVKIDNSDTTSNALINARRSKQNEDWFSTEKYYKIVEENDPTNIEAISYSAYGKAKQSLLDDDVFKRKAIFKVLTNCVSSLDGNFSMEREQENREMIILIHNDIINMVQSSFVYTQVTKGDEKTDNSNETYRLFISLQSAFIDALCGIAEKYEPQENGIYLYKMALAQCGVLAKNRTANLSSVKKLTNRIQAVISYIDGSKQPPYEQAIELEKKGDEQSMAEAYKLFDSMRGYRDSSAHAQKCRAAFDAVEGNRKKKLFMISWILFGVSALFTLLSAAVPVFAFFLMITLPIAIVMQVKLRKK